MEGPDGVKGALQDDDVERFQGMADLFERYAGEYEFDWLMVAAQAYQESRLDQSVRSRAGAIGVMQLLQSTANSVGIPEIYDVENNIHAGVKYLRLLRDQYFNDPDIVSDFQRVKLRVNETGWEEVISPLLDSPPDCRFIDVEQHELYPKAGRETGEDALAVGGPQRRAGDDHGPARSSDALGYTREPLDAILVCERLSSSHLGNVGRGVVVVSLDEAEPTTERIGQTLCHGRLATPSHPAYDDRVG